MSILRSNYQGNDGIIIILDILEQLSNTMSSIISCLIVYTLLRFPKPRDARVVFGMWLWSCLYVVCQPFSSSFCSEHHLLSYFAKPFDRTVDLGTFVVCPSCVQMELLKEGNAHKTILNNSSIVNSWSSHMCIITNEVVCGFILVGLLKSFRTCYHPLKFYTNMVIPQSSIVHCPHNPIPRLVWYMVGLSMNGSTMFINESTMLLCRVHPRPRKHWPPIMPLSVKGSIQCIHPLMGILNPFNHEA